MTTDKELLKLVAKAADDDGAALRLASKRRLKVFCRTCSVEVCSEDGKVRCIEAHKDDPYAATRRAIVRAAAEIGKTK